MPRAAGIVGFSREEGVSKTIFKEDGTACVASNINGYLEDKPNVSLERRKNPICNVLPMVRGCGATDGGNLILEPDEKDKLVATCPEADAWIKPFSMGAEYINGKDRYCLWLVGITEEELDDMPSVKERYIAVPKVSSGRREYVPMGFVTNGMIPGDKLFYISDAGLFEFGVLMSRCSV